jgi:hypothetical protein
MKKLNTRFLHLPLERGVWKFLQFGSLFTQPSNQEIKHWLPVDNMANVTDSGLCWNSGSNNNKSEIIT